MRVVIFGLLAVLPAAALAQTRPVPALTNDDVIVTRPAAPAAPPTKAGESQPEKKATVAEKAKPAGDEQKREAERAWNKEVRQAREKAKSLEREADQTELEINRLRNVQFSAGPKAPETSGQINERVAALTEQLKRLRTEAKLAQQEVDVLLAAGGARGFEEREPSLTDAKGRPDAGAYQSRLAELQGDLRDAEARIQVLQLRLNDIFTTKRRQEGGDQFFYNRLRAEQAEATAELQEARALVAELTQQVEELKRKGRAAGLESAELR